MPSFMRSQLFSGAFTAMVTPFSDGEIDEPTLRRLVDFQIESGIHGLVPCGTTGESATMTDAERDRVIEIVIEQTAGRVPVIAGVGSNSTAQTIAHAHHAARAGADGLLVVVPYYNKPTQGGIVAHMSAVADATDIPVVLYNVPGRTGVNMLPETTIELSRHPRIVAVKEASGSLDAVSEIVGGTTADFAVLSGDDSLTLPMISVGARGVISVASNVVPAQVAGLVSAANAGEFGAAGTIHRQLFNLFRAMFLENNPTAVKAAMEMAGLCRSEVRLPLVGLGDASLAPVRHALQPWLQQNQAAA